MKKILSVLVLFALAFCFMGCNNDDPEFYNDLNDKNQKILTVVLSPDYAPYEFISDYKKSGYKQYAGADIEVAKYIAKELGYKLKIQSAKFDVCPNEVDSGKADCSISGFSWTVKRSENYELSDPYFDEGDGKQQLIILKENESKFTTMDSLNVAGVKVAAQGGSLQDELVDKFLPNATKENFTNIDQAIQLLINKKYDAIALSEYTIDVRMEDNDKLARLAEDFETPALGYVVLAKKGNTELINQINEVIKKIVEQGLYSKWMDEAKKIAGE